MEEFKRGAIIPGIPGMEEVIQHMKDERAGNHPVLKGWEDDHTINTFTFDMWRVGFLMSYYMNSFGNGIGRKLQDAIEDRFMFTEWKKTTGPSRWRNAQFYSKGWSKKGPILLIFASIVVKTFFKISFNPFLLSHSAGFKERREGSCILSHRDRPRLLKKGILYSLRETIDSCRNAH